MKHNKAKNLEQDESSFCMCCSEWFPIKDLKQITKRAADGRILRVYHLCRKHQSRKHLAEADKAALDSLLVLHEMKPEQYGHPNSPHEEK